MSDKELKQLAIIAAGLAPVSPPVMGAAPSPTTQASGLAKVNLAADGSPPVGLSGTYGYLRISSENHPAVNTQPTKYERRG